MNRHFLLRMCSCIPLLLFVSCSPQSTKERRDLSAANERIRVLEDNIATLQDENRRLKSGWEEEEKRIRSSHENQIRTINETNKQKVSDLENKLAEYRNNYSVSERQRIALQELIDQPERVKSLQERNFYMERMVWISLLCVCIIISIILSHRYYNAREQNRNHIVRLVSRHSRAGNLE